MQVRLSALWACSPFIRYSFSPTRFLSQSLNATWSYQELASACAAVVSVLCGTVSCRPAVFMQPVRTSPLGLADEGRRLTFRTPVTFQRFHVKFSRSWVLRLVPVEEASTWMSNLNSADTTSAFGIVHGFQTLTKNALRLFPSIRDYSDQASLGNVGKSAVRHLSMWLYQASRELNAFQL